MTARAVKSKASLDLTDALVLVSCVSQKLSEPAPARLLYLEAGEAELAKGLGHSRAVTERGQVYFRHISDKIVFPEPLPKKKPL